MKKYLLGVFLVVTMNLFGAKLSEIKGLENLKNFNEIKDTQVEKIVNYDETIKKDKKIYSIKNSNLFSGVVVKKENNDIVELSFFKNGVNEGVSYSYYLNGDLKSISTYRKGMIEGPQILYRPNGNLESEQVIENNSLVSEKYYDKNGKITKEYHFNKLRNGILKKYYKDTEKMSSTSTVMVRRDKVDNVEKMSFIFDGETKIFREDGTLMAILQYKDGSLESLTQKFYYPNGKIQYYVVAGDDIKDFKVKDRIITYYDNGKVKQDCNQQSDGSWLCKNYDENGKFIDEEIRGAEPISNGDTKFWENILNENLSILSK
ncbi:toxin-antitoxin system YwqK family antitoxin [Fusobacterium simiae]|uniref:toxin-antitoxin system YwqK family antitoxin n=1 Tax=Fusobacterium simiae TaxID=855 RepID=UPI0020C29ADB|nr:toxin-antitoxin system YwqK family antitoxin [Fusobacterium simiae]MDC7955783.1 toxin-antitoxin system YwqK family antitoxin [Fusobacterium simiae]